MSVISVNEWFNESIRLFDGKRSTGQSFVEQHQERIFNPFPVHVHDLVDVVVDVTCEPHGDRLGQVTQSTDHDSNGSEADESHRLDSLLHLFLSIVWIIGINRCLTVLYLDNWSQNLDLDVAIEQQFPVFDEPVVVKDTQFLQPNSDSQWLDSHRTFDPRFLFPHRCISSGDTTIVQIDENVVLWQVDCWVGKHHQWLIRFQILHTKSQKPIHILIQSFSSPAGKFSLSFWSVVSRWWTVNTLYEVWVFGWHNRLPGPWTECQKDLWISNVIRPVLEEVEIRWRCIIVILIDNWNEREWDEHNEMLNFTNFEKQMTDRWLQWSRWVKQMLWTKHKLRQEDSCR